MFLFLLKRSIKYASGSNTRSNLIGNHIVYPYKNEYRALEDSKNVCPTECFVAFKHRKQGHINNKSDHSQCCLYLFQICMLLVLMISETSNAGYFKWITKVVSTQNLMIPETSNAGYFKWITKAVSTQNLMCPLSCKAITGLYGHFGGASDFKCCASLSSPFWLIGKYKSSICELNLKNSDGTNQCSKNTIFYKIIHTHTNITSIPKRLLSSNQTVEIDFQKNQIVNITGSDFECFPVLDRLDLSHNKISKLENTTFVKLKNLRRLDLSYNVIQYIEPRTFSYRPGSLLLIYLFGNMLKSVDVTNVFFGYWISAIHFDHNKISKLTNQLMLGMENFTGGGDIYMGQNNISHLPNILDIGFTRGSIVKMISFKYGFHLGGNPWFCDCKFAWFVPLLKLARKNFDVGDQMICKYPISLRGTFVVNVPNDLFVCNISVEEKCPLSCNCFEQPSRKRVVVNCSFSRKYIIPSAFPQKANLDIDLSHNLITIFEKRAYLNRTVAINLSFNKIKVLDPLVYGIETLKIINVENNQITDLHRNVQLMKNGRKIVIGNITIECSCRKKWIANWLEYQNRLLVRHDRIVCRQRNEELITFYMIDNCSFRKKYLAYEQYIIVGSFLIVLIATLTRLIFKYEIYLLLRKFRHKFMFNFFNRVEQSSTFDIYISFSEEKENISKWVIGDLTKHLETCGFKVCLPPRDFDLGGVHVDQIMTQIATSKNYAVLLGDDYLKTQYQVIEWGHIWNNYKRNINSKLLVINYDMLHSKNIKDHRLKAFLRLQYFIDFSNFDKKLLKKIENELR
ncbi:unnamed protein product [Mytilus edulis]|uniref:TIR domain-containing protein n=1 Tax=Mytilus edulis TaxID=6550 RepID=A0A8S3RMK6_MYTED|nr:unnamed protein product [Mytilus edulis]